MNSHGHHLLHAPSALAKHACQTPCSTLTSSAPDELRARATAWLAPRQASTGRQSPASPLWTGPARACMLACADFEAPGGHACCSGAAA